MWTTSWAQALKHGLVCAQPAGPKRAPRVLFVDCQRPRDDYLR